MTSLPVRGSEIIFLIGVVVGAAGIAGLDRSRLSPTWSYAFYYVYNGDKAIAVKPDGKIEFGPAYSADTLRQLLDGLKGMRQQLQFGAVDCHETGYRFPLGDPAADGVIRIYPGTAPPRPPRQASDL